MSRERLPDINKNYIYKDLRNRYGELVFNVSDVNPLRSEMERSVNLSSKEEEWSPATAVKMPNYAPVRVLASVDKAFDIAKVVCRTDKKTGFINIHEFAPAGINLR